MEVLMVEGRNCCPFASGGATQKKALSDEALEPFLSRVPRCERTPSSISPPPLPRSVCMVLPHFVAQRPQFMFLVMFFLVMILVMSTKVSTKVPTKVSAKVSSNVSTRNVHKSVHQSVHKKCPQKCPQTCPQKCPQNGPSFGKLIKRYKTQCF